MRRLILTAGSLQNGQFSFLTAKNEPWQPGHGATTIVAGQRCPVRHSFHEHKVREGVSGKTPSGWEEMFSGLGAEEGLCGIILGNYPGGPIRYFNPSIAYNLF